MEIELTNDELKWITGYQFEISTLKNENRRMTNEFVILPNSKREKKFFGTAQLGKHTNGKYSRRFEYKISGKQFAADYLLNCHLRVHAEEKLFQCNYQGCDKTLNNSGSFENV